MKFTFAVFACLCLSACAGRPSFSNPECETDYADCTASCEKDCPAAEPLAPYDTAQPEDLHLACAQCVSQCTVAAKKCEERVLPQE